MKERQAANRFDKTLGYAASSYIESDRVGGVAAHSPIVAMQSEGYSESDGEALLGGHVVYLSSILTLDRGKTVRYEIPFVNAN